MAIASFSVETATLSTANEVLAVDNTAVVAAAARPSASALLSFACPIGQKAVPPMILPILFTMPAPSCSGWLCNAFLTGRLKLHHSLENWNTFIKFKDSSFKPTEPCTGTLE
jgi:hypothetical protein